MSPDILLFISDQHAPQYQAGGQMPVDTPNLAALREQGTAFDAAYTPCPLCVPARMAMLSGLSPYHTAIFTNNDTLPQTTPTFLHAMAAAGYETVLVGRMHFIGPDQRHGFTRRVAPDFTNSGWVRPQKALEQDFGVHTQTMGYNGALMWSAAALRPLCVMTIWCWMLWNSTLPSPTANRSSLWWAPMARTSRMLHRRSCF